MPSSARIRSRALCKFASRSPRFDPSAIAALMLRFPVETGVPPANQKKQPTRLPLQGRAVHESSIACTESVFPVVARVSRAIGSGLVQRTRLPLQAQHIAHVIKPGRFSDDPSRCAQGATRECFAAARAMRQL